jgi:hypothetical protein
MAMIATNQLHAVSSLASPGASADAAAKRAISAPSSGPAITFKGNLEQLAITISSLMPGSVVDLDSAVVVSAVRFLTTVTAYAACRRPSPCMAMVPWWPPASVTL